MPERPRKDGRPRAFSMSLGRVDPLDVQKAEKKGRTMPELDEIIAWLTGYRGTGPRAGRRERRHPRGLFENAPRMNPNAGLITGVVYGVRVEATEDPLQKIRYLDELAEALG